MPSLIRGFEKTAACSVRPIIENPILTAAGIILFCGLPVSLLFINFLTGGISLNVFSGNIVYGILTALFQTWILLLVGNILGGVKCWLSKIWLGVAYCALAFNFIVDFVCICLNGQFFSQEYVAVALGTNSDELKEFMQGLLGQMKTACLVSEMIIPCLLFAITYYLIEKFAHTFSLRVSVVASVLAGGAMFFCIPPPAIGRSDIWSKIDSMISFNPGNDLENENLPMKMKSDFRQSPTVIIIFGESHSGNFSQLYGYDRLNQPRLAKMAEDSLLWVYKKAFSPSINTYRSFSRFITTASEEENQEWWKFTNPFEIADNAGYETYWLSNQSETGYFDNVITKIAEGAGHKKFTHTNNLTGGQTFYDESLLPLIDEVLEGERDSGHYKKLLFVHLMGSHLLYQNRYPTDRQKFNENDFTDYPGYQRADLAAYNNSIYYNDSVVSEIFERCSDRDAVGMYFSDHGQDIYQIQDKAAHADIHNPKSVEVGKQIPLYIYTSPVYKKLHPEMVSRISMSLADSVNTENFPYTLMDILGIEFVNDDRVAERSMIINETP